MRKNLDEKLTKSFPLLYRDRYGDKRKTAMCWGFPNSGWFSLIWDASKQIEKLIETKYPELKATQIKEKFAALRLYTSEHHDEIESIIDEASRISRKNCDVCGLKGKERNNGWYVTRCDKHINSHRENVESIKIHWSVMLKHYIKNWKYYIRENK